ncbi:hypothetical protein LTR97_008135 [Elasticomyces elasticus]|uniref:Alpha-galactosidase n=1 Tax=Elasticomyces elasticus TaxID=574655 RepID=A0AAN8A1Z8_9PEZI|nr:hypothetical protein LTR97_008135 [Elasticomyces elasticus]
MFPHIACEPPIGLVTVETGPSITFHASLSARDAGLYQVAVWHDGNTTRSWDALELRRVNSINDTHYFSGSFTPPVSTVHFTLKFRSSDHEWEWLNDHEPHPDGTLVLQAQEIPARVEDFLEGWDESWAVEQQHSGDVACLAWTLTANVEPSSESESSWSSRSIGTPKNLLKWFALVRHSTPWLGPRQGDASFSPDKAALLVSFLRGDGLHMVMLALNGIPDCLTTFDGDGSGRVIVTTRNDGQQHGRSTVLIAAAKVLDTAITAVVSSAKQLLAPEESAIGGSTGEVTPDLERWYDAFTYCTWNGLGQQLNEEKIMSAIARLEEVGLDFPTLIIDDNWQTLDFNGNSNFEYKWANFEANQEGFPQGLKHTVSKIREAHPKIKHIAVWHGMFGYWGGMDPNGHILKCYKPRQAMKQTAESYLSNGPIYTVQGHDIGQMYDDFYAFLAESGIDSVKTDNSFMPDYLAEASDRRDTVYTYQDAWLAAVKKHFQHRAISCMSQTPQILFHTFLASGDRPSYLARNSDDFFPHEPSSHTWHLFCNAHNALLTQHLNLLPDWDMFQTAGQFAKMHAVGRCLSGGPLYITDPPGEHDFDLIQRMIARSIDGRSIALRPERVAVTMEVYVKPHSDRLLRLGTTHQGASMLGLMNVGDGTVIELAKLASFPGVDTNISYVVCKHFNAATIGPMHVADELPFVSISLGVGDVEILSAAPVHAVGGVRFAVLGLLGKMTGAAVVRSFEIDEGGNDVVKLSLNLKAVGNFGIWLANAQSFIASKSIDATLRVGESTRNVGVSLEKHEVLELDLEEAWRAVCGEGSTDTVAVLTVSFGKAGSH